MKRLLEILRTASPNAAETMLALCEHLADFDAKKAEPDKYTANCNALPIERTFLC